jgi:hypothetical protein
MAFGFLDRAHGDDDLKLWVLTRDLIVVFKTASRVRVSGEISADCPPNPEKSNRSTNKISR